MPEVVSQEYKAMQQKEVPIGKGEMTGTNLTEELFENDSAKAASRMEKEAGANQKEMLKAEKAGKTMGRILENRV